MPVFLLKNGGFSRGSSRISVSPPAPAPSAVVLSRGLIFWFIWGFLWPVPRPASPLGSVFASCRMDHVKETASWAHSNLRPPPSSLHPTILRESLYFCGFFLFLFFFKVLFCFGLFSHFCNISSTFASFLSSRYGLCLRHPLNQPPRRGGFKLGLRER